MSAPAAEVLAQWAGGLVAAGVSSRERDLVRMRFLDYATNVAGGHARPSVVRLARYAGRFPGVVPVPGGGTAMEEAAALPLGAAAHVLECDDTHQPSSSHPGAVVFSTAFPLALAESIGWELFCAAVVAGYEVMCRVGAASDPAAEYAHGFHPTGTAGVFGAAATATILLGGRPRDISAALGIAASMSAGSMSFLTNGAWTKHLHPGWAAHGGIIAARLAIDGYRAPIAVFEPPLGYLARHTAADGAAALVDGLGEAPLAIARTSVKAHGCCRYEQPALDAVLHLKRQHNVEADDVAAVEVGVLDAAWNIVAAPAERKRRPRSAVEAQFSMPFGMAVALRHDSASVHHHTDEMTRDPVVSALMDAVTCVRDPDLDAVYPARWPAWVRITLRDGSQLSHRVDHPKGDPENPFTMKEMVERIHDVAREAGPDEREALAAAFGRDDPVPAVGDALARLEVDAADALRSPAAAG